MANAPSFRGPVIKMEVSMDFINHKQLGKSIRGMILGKLMLWRRAVLADAYLTAADFSWPVKFEAHISYKGGDVGVAVMTDDFIWKKLDEGTHERWAKMRRPFEPKTKPGRISSGQGVRTYRSSTTRGGWAGSDYTAIRGRQYMQAHGISPKPGIVARNWSQRIHDKHQRFFQQDMSRSFRRLFNTAARTRVTIK